MSGSDNKQSSDCSVRGDGGGRDEQGKEIDESVERISPEEEIVQRRGKGVFFLGFNIAKRNLLLLKSKKKKKKKKKRKNEWVNSRVSGVGGGFCCCLCIRQPVTLDSSMESPTSDPNSKEFTYDMMRVLIEKNEFYSKECNPHL